jgi:CBS domain containing-hemolysin-like protein
VTGTDIAALVVAIVLELLAGLLVCSEAALSSFSKARAEELAEEHRAGAAKLRRLLDDPARYLNTALFLRLACELTAVVLVSFVVYGELGHQWLEILVAAVGMIFISYVIVGVTPRTLGRQHADAVATRSAGVLMAVTSVLGPLPALLILIGNALTPGKGFRDGPFASEAELRELVDFAEASQVIESDERKMIHSVFELGDTIVREVMVPRTDMVYVERTKALRQVMSLALRSGFSRIPVVGENLDDVVGVAYLKDVAKRTYDRSEETASRPVDEVMREPLFVPDSMPADELMRQMQSQRRHVAIVIDEYGGTAGMVTIEDILEEIVGEITDEYDRAPIEAEHLPDGAVRVSSRLGIDDLGELFGLDLDDDDVDTVGGLMAKYLGKVPIPGSDVEVAGLELVAEAALGRRNRLGTIRVRQLEPEPKAEEEEEDA